jgi:hypothetical protein
MKAMTYKEIKERLTQCEDTLKKLKASDNTKSPETEIKYAKAIRTLSEQISKFKKMLKEGPEKTYIITPKGGKPTAASMSDDEIEGIKDADDVEAIKGVDGAEIKEGAKFDLETTKLIAGKVGEAVYKALKALGDEVAHMKAVNIEDSDFDIKVEYKKDTNIDQFSFYIDEDNLILVDFSFRKTIGKVGQKPSGEPIVQVDVIADALQKHFKSLSEGMSDQEFADAKEKERLEKHPEKDKIKAVQAMMQKEKKVNEAPEGMFYIKVAVRDARKALAIIDDQPALKHEVEISGSDTYYLKDEQLAYDLMMDFNAMDVEVVDTNVDEDNLEEYKSDYAKRRAAERDYQPSKRDVPPKKYKEPSNDYFARRKAEMEEGDVDAEMDGGDLDVGHQDDEPNMLKKDLYDIITYAAKLYKQLDKYDQHDGEVDFPQWWQKKVILARDYMSAAQHYLEGEEKQPAISQLALENASAEEEDKFHNKLDTLVHKTFGKREDELEEGTELYDRNGIQIKRFFGGEKGVMVQITIGGKYIVVPAAEYPFLVRAMQSVQEDLKDMSRQLPRAKNMNEESVAKVQKAYGLVVLKMKELAKQYKAGDSSVISQLKDLTAKKKELEKKLEKAVAGTNRNQQLDAGGIDEASRAKVSMPRFVKDKNNPNFLNVYIDYDLGPGGSSIALGKETMTGQIRRESAAEAMRLAGDVAKDLEAKYNLEDIDIQDLENGKVRIFAVSDDFINMDPTRMEEQPIQEEKATYCGRCKTTHKKSSGCPKK